MLKTGAEMCTGGGTGVSLAGCRLGRRIEGMSWVRTAVELRRREELKDHLVGGRSCSFGTRDIPNRIRAEDWVVETTNIIR